MDTSAKIFVAGHHGMVGSSIVRSLQRNGYTNLLLRSSSELDLRDQRSTMDFFADEKPDYVFMAAAKVGGILANKEQQAEFFYDNLAIELHTIHAAHLSGVKKFCFLGSSCIYPKLAPQPIKEDALMTGHLEPTNFGYASAKIAGVKMCEAYHDQYGFSYVALMPCNLYGPGDNFDPRSSHVLPALLRRVIETKERGEETIVLWGTGTPKREFLYVDDVASACLFLMQNEQATGLFNVGMGEDIATKDLLEKICQIVGYQGTIVPDLSKPDGTPRKVLDVSKLQALGWKPTVDLDAGIQLLYAWFLEHRGEFV
ncbi:GDP-L-fucose synthase [Candidatus Uhrbacteria bacterium]|nr:GDP-L-fucose synthase [Candidatus Uhrbacteria bacterium]